MKKLKKITSTLIFYTYQYSKVNLFQAVCADITEFLDHIISFNEIQFNLNWSWNSFKSSWNSNKKLQKLYELCSLFPNKKPTVKCGFTYYSLRCFQINITLVLVTINQFDLNIQFYVTNKYLSPSEQLPIRNVTMKMYALIENEQ